MRPIYDALKIFESLSTPTATFPKIFNGLLFRSILWIWVQNLKFVALPIPEIVGGTHKIWAAPGYSPFAFLWMYQPNLKSVALPVPETIAIEVLWVENPQSWGTGRRRGSGMVPFERVLVSSYRLSIVTFPLYLRFSEYCCCCAAARHYSHPTSPQNFPMFTWDYRWMAFWLRRANVLD